MTDTNTDSSKNKIIFAPSCLLCPEFMAKGEASLKLWSQKIIDWLNSNNFSIIQMPCPEASFPDYYEGLNRSPHGIKYYKELPGYKQHCIDIGESVLKQIDALYKSGYSVSAVLGIEYSPTCAVNYIYTRQGTQKRQGIFIYNLAKLIENRGYHIPIIGINRRHPNKAIQLLIENFEE